MEDKDTKNIQIGIEEIDHWHVPADLKIVHSEDIAQTKDSVNNCNK